MKKDTIQKRLEKRGYKVMFCYSQTHSSIIIKGGQQNKSFRNLHEAFRYYFN